ncbi:MAG: putative peptidoglycan binding domain-containing protein [Candidatus Competibacter sp.]|nr:putative peptidoglycan binding domain-containing protein [Candidatus Competibacter sp.]
MSVYDHPAPIDELERLYAIHRLTYFRSDPAHLVRIDTAIANELQQILHARGFYKGVATGLCDEEMLRALRDFMGWENYDERIRDDDQIDLEVLDDIRRKHALWLQGR